MVIVERIPFRWLNLIPMAMPRARAFRLFSAHHNYVNPWNFLDSFWEFDALKSAMVATFCEYSII